MQELEEKAEVVIIVDNGGLMEMLPSSTSIHWVLGRSRHILTLGVEAFCSTTIACLPLAELRRVLSGPQKGAVGTGATESGGIFEAFEKAIYSPLLRTVSLSEAEVVMCNVTLDRGDAYGELMQGLSLLSNELGENTHLLWIYFLSRGAPPEVTLVATRRL